MKKKELKKVVKQIFAAYETTFKIANKIDRCFGGFNDILEPILTELHTALTAPDVLALYTITCILDDLKSGDISVKEATDRYLEYVEE